MADTNWPKGWIFYCMWHHAQHTKLREETGMGEKFETMAFVFMSNLYMWRSPVLLGMAEHLLALEKQWVGFALVLICLCLQFLLYLLNYLCLNTQVSSLLLFLFPPLPHCWSVSSVCGVFSCWMNLNHENHLQVLLLQLENNSVGSRKKKKFLWENKKENIIKFIQFSFFSSLLGLGVY